MTTRMIDTVELKDTENFDIPDMPKYKKVITKLQGGCVKIMCAVNPEFKKDLCEKSGQEGSMNIFPTSYKWIHIVGSSVI